MGIDRNGFEKLRRKTVDGLIFKILEQHLVIPGEIPEDHKQKT